MAWGMGLKKTTFYISIDTRCPFKFFKLLSIPPQAVGYSKDLNKGKLVLKALDLAQGQGARRRNCAAYLYT